MDRPRTRAAALAALCAIWLSTGPATAQEWFTKKACTVTDPAIDPAALPADLLADLRAESASVPNAVGRLWKITSPGGRVSHIWGTLHDTSPLILDLPDELRAVLAEAKVFAPEFDPVAESRAAIDAIRQGKGFWADDGDAASVDEMDPRVAEWLRLRLDATGYGRASLEHLSWAGLAALVLESPCNDFAAGVIPIQDSRLHVLAVEAGARVVGLEPADIFMQEMNDPDRREIVQAIVEGYGAYLSPEDVKAGRRTGFHLYLTGQLGLMMAWDTAYMQAFFGAEKGARIAGLVNGYLVAERNRRFLETAQPLLEEGGAVLAVGAFHLPGPEGMVALLREAGFTVERVRTEGEVE